MSSEKRLRFMSWNSNGLETKINKVKTVIKKQNCDVVFLQETHSDKSEIFEVLDDYKSFYTTQSSHIVGVAILIKTKIFEETGCTIERDPAGFYIVVKCTLNGQLFTLVSVYNCIDDMKRLMTLRCELEKHAEGILLIGGDLNVALNPYLDRTSKKKNKNHLLMRPFVEEFMTSFHLVDVWRRLHPRDRQYSYQENHIKSRLDYILVPEESMQYAEKCEISRVKPCSDHLPVVFEIMFKEESMKPEFCLDISKESNMLISRFQESAVNEWLSCKHECGKDIDLTVNPNTPQMISASEIEWAIQTLIVNDVKRPDGLPVSFYKSYSYVLIPHLCAFYNNLLDQPENIPKCFNDRIKVSKNNCIFNVDYLILASIMAKWLDEHLQSNLADYTDDDDEQQTDEMKRVLIALKKHKQNVEVKWSLLNTILDKEKDKHRTNPPLPEKFKSDVLYKILKNCPKDEYKLIQRGCPLTPVLITLCNKHIANEISHTFIHISQENVIVRLSKEVNLDIPFNNTIKYKNLE